MSKLATILLMFNNNNNSSDLSTLINHPDVERLFCARATRARARQCLGPLLERGATPTGPICAQPRASHPPTLIFYELWS
jgi:hypothetical protein